MKSMKDILKFKNRMSIWGIPTNFGAMVPLFQTLVGRSLATKSNFDFANRPRRALMYVPASDDRKMKKIENLKADLIAMDCEDGVAMNMKEKARTNIHQYLHSEYDIDGELTVRVNSASSGLMEQDLKCSLTAPVLPQGLLLPKVDTIEDIDAFAAGVERAWQSRGVVPDQCLSLTMFCESARSVINLAELLQYSLRRLPSVRCVPVAIVLGSDDLCSDLGVTRSVFGEEISYARQKIVLTAKAFNMQAIDMVHIDFKDHEALRRSCEQGVKLGYTGKQVIHPSQIDIVQETFSPTAGQVEWACSLIDTFQQQQNLGKGAFEFRGKMIDMPLLRQARNILITHSTTSSSEQIQQKLNVLANYICDQNQK